MRRLTLITMTVLAVTILSACGKSGHDPERYVLTGNDTNLFYKKELAIDPRRTDEIIATTRAFAKEHNMDFLLARESLPAGDFNTSVNGPTLNIKAMHTAAVDDKGVQVFAIVPKQPSARDEALVAEFVCRLEKNCGLGERTDRQPKAR